VSRRKHQPRPDQPCDGMCSCAPQIPNARARAARSGYTLVMMDNVPPCSFDRSARWRTCDPRRRRGAGGRALLHRRGAGGRAADDGRRRHRAGRHYPPGSRGRLLRRPGRWVPGRVRGRGNRRHPGLGVATRPTRRLSSDRAGAGRESAQARVVRRRRGVPSTGPAARANSASSGPAKRIRAVPGRGFRGQPIPPAGIAGKAAWRKSERRRFLLLESPIWGTCPC
jgi:hypothetical protein